MMENLSVNMVVKYSSHNVNQAGGVTVTVKAMYDQMVNSVQLLRMLLSNIDVKAKVPGGKPFRLGIFKVKSVSFNANGESTIKLASIVEAVEMNNMPSIVTLDLFNMRFEAEVD